MNRRHASLPLRGSQRGSIIVPVAVSLALGLFLLGSVQMAYFFYMKRDLQKAADLSALAAAQVLAPADCGRPDTVARASVTANLPASTTRRVAVQCGRWQPVADPVAGYAARPGPRHFQAQPVSEPLNAVHVVVSDAAPLLAPFFTGSRDISAEALAALQDPAAVFSVGSGLVTTDQTAPVMELLKLVGVSPDLDLVRYGELAGVHITPAGLLEALNIPVDTDIGVGELDTLLAARKISLGELLNAMVRLAGHSDLLELNADLLDALAGAGLAADSLLVQLGTDPAGGGLRGLFAKIEAPTAASALNAQVDALSLLTAAVGAATAGHGITLSVGSDLLATLTGLEISAEARVVEPPSIGIGGVGAVAYNSQVRVHVNVDTGEPGGGGLVSSLLNTLKTRIHLPVFIDLVNARGELIGMSCDPPPGQATIRVTSTVLNACIGDPISADAIFSTQDMCATNLQDDTSFVKLLGFDLLHGKSYVPGLSHSQDITLAPGETVSTDVNPLKIGDTVADLLTSLLGLVSDGGQAAEREPVPAQDMVDVYLPRSGSTLSASDANQIRNRLIQDGLDWDRPLLGVLTQSMPAEWRGNLDARCKVSLLSSNYKMDCARDELLKSLQTSQQCGLVQCLVGPVVDLLAQVLGGSDYAGQPGGGLLQGVLMPLVQTVLQPILNALGQLVSDLLASIVGLDLGRTDVSLQSLGCYNVRLVY